MVPRVGIPIRKSRRHWLVVAAAFAITCGAATAGALGMTDNPSLRSAASSTGAHASTKASATASATQKLAPGAHKMEFGLNYASTLLAESQPQMVESLQDAVVVGATWIRVDLPWNQVQPINDLTYDWTGFDRVVGTAQALGLHVDAILDATPYWDVTAACKRGVSDTEFCPPDDTAFARFARAAAQHYQSGVGAWEIWNEPNITARWWPAPSTAAYAQMLIAASQSIRSVSPNAVILLGGLAAVPDNPSLGYVSQNTFLSGVAGVKGSMTDVNAVSFHPFSAPILASAAGDYQDISSTPGNMLSILQANGDARVQFWITESGTNEYDGANPPAGTVATASQLQEQAAYATDLVKTVSTNPNVAVDFWFSEQDIPSQDLYWGLRDANGNARPAFFALKAAIAACGCSR
jgi:hypothetical protein